MTVRDNETFVSRYSRPCSSELTVAGERVISGGTMLLVKASRSVSKFGKSKIMMRAVMEKC
jgi:hypothetical protein